MRYEVTDADTAARVGSGDVPVLATPRLIAWLEAATVQAVDGSGRVVAAGEIDRVIVDREQFLDS